MIKKILIAVLVLIIIGVGTGIYLWNKPHPKAKNGIPVTAERITKEYSSDEKASNTKYLDKTLEVTGVISSVTKNQDGGIVATLETGDPMSEVQCTFLDKNVSISKGQKITIEGFCRGNNMGVILNDCVIK